MAEFSVNFEGITDPIRVPGGTLISDAAHQAGVQLGQPCGGQGRCGRCVVQVLEGTVRRRSTLRLSEADLDQGFALACQTVIEGDIRVRVPPQEVLERRLVTDLTVAEVQVPTDYDYRQFQSIQRVQLVLDTPTMEDQTDDWSRVSTALRLQGGQDKVKIPLPLLQKLGSILRESENNNQWWVTSIVDRGDPARGDSPTLIDILPGIIPGDAPMWGAAIDIGTTTVTVWLVDLISGQVVAQASEYNGQIARGEDVISRIVYAGKNDGYKEMQRLVLDTINNLLGLVCHRARHFWKTQTGDELLIQPENIVKATIAGNSTMIHLFLAIPANHIRLAPFITTANHIPNLQAREIGLKINPLGTIDCLPGVASYMGSDISAGVLASGMDDSDQLTLFMDVGTNGEIVLGNREWLVACACSAGPAFEGAGVHHGMRATRGAIEEVWINEANDEPSYRVIGNVHPRGICGSGLISLLAEMFMTGVIDKAGNLNTHLKSPRIREGERGLEYVLAWASECTECIDITFTHTDIDNLIRTKGAIYAGYTVLADSVGVSLDMIERMLIGGSFGKYINVEKAIQIGLLPDMPWDRFQFLGNTAVKGAYYALLDTRKRRQVNEIASRMTYIELSADNSFYEAFMSALFLPHTDESRFPSVAAQKAAAASPAAETAI